MNLASADAMAITTAPRITTATSTSIRVNPLRDFISEFLLPGIVEISKPAIATGTTLYFNGTSVIHALGVTARSTLRAQVEAASFTRAAVTMKSDARLAGDDLGER